VCRQLSRCIRPCSFTTIDDIHQTKQRIKSNEKVCVCVREQSNKNIAVAMDQTTRGRMVYCEVREVITKRSSQ
jgi:hypothetical protein